MKDEKEQTTIIKTTNYLNKQYRHSSFRKLMMKSYYTRYFPKTKLNEDFNGINKTESNYYKDPKFYNEKNLDFQINILRKLSEDNSIKKINNRKFTYSLKSSYSFENKILPNLKRNKTMDLNIKTKIDTKINNITNYNNLTYRRSRFFYNRANTEPSLNNEALKDNQELSIDKLYKIIFKSQLPKNKDHLKPLIENIYNLKYSENEEEYNMIIDKENEKKISKGQKIKNKKPNVSIKLKLNDALDKVKFMKDIIDYSYPKFVLSKIKVKQKNLSEMKKRRNKIFNSFLNEKEKRLKEIKMRNDIRTQYLLKSFSFLK